MEKQSKLTRRDFISTAAVAGAVLTAAPYIVRGQTATKRWAGKTVKVALVGCGGRGNGALENHKQACEYLGIDMKLVATADAFADKALATGQKYGLAADRCFGGFDAYKKAIASDAEIVLMATPPAFRPSHFAATIAAGKHAFMEKPVAVDAPGIRKVIAAGEEAKTKKLSVVAGTQRRHQSSYRKCYEALKQGAIGKICGGAVYWCGGALWYKNREQGQSDAEYMCRNWVSFMEMSGDHIVEQHVHNIDVANWYIGRLPIAAAGFGGRARRVTGNQFDFFSVDFDYGEGLHIHSMCRQVNGTYGRVSEIFNGSEGNMWGGGKITGKKIEIPDFEEYNGPYCQEHVNLLDSIMKGEAFNEAYNVATSTACAIMGRYAAYTGEMYRLDDLLKNESSPLYGAAVSPSADDFEKGTVKLPEEKPPVPGKG